MSKPTFDQSKAYVAQEDDVYFDDGREIELLHFIYSKTNIDEIRGSPEKVIQAIDEYGRTKKYLMTVGEDKGKIVTDLIREVKPKIMVELGGYTGYSAVLFGKTLRDVGGQQYISLERNPEFAAVTLSLVDLAGLKDFVTVRVGSSDEGLKYLHKNTQVDQINLMFIDHYKPAYLTDLKLCEELRMIRPGSVLAADNVIKPGNPPYLEYVRSGVNQKLKALEDLKPGATVEDGFEDKVARMYEQRQGTESLDATLKGNPRLVYESRMIHSFEPTGVPDAIEITRCVGEQTS